MLSNDKKKGTMNFDAKKEEAVLLLLSIAALFNEFVDGDDETFGDEFNEERFIDD